MKRANFIIIFLMLVSLAGYAQKEPKPKAPQVEKAKVLLDKKDLKGAKDIIDYALIYDKTKDKSKTHYYAGLVYETMFYLQDSGKIAEIDPLAYEKCADGFKKVKTLENQYGMYYNFADLRLNSLYSYIFNRAAQQYQNEEYSKALMNFDRVSKIYDNDTTAIAYAGYAAQQISNVYQDSANTVDQSNTTAVKNYKNKQNEMMEIALQHFELLSDHNME